MLPSIKAAKKIARLVDTTVGYLLSETQEDNLFKDPKMLQRFQDINNFQIKKKNTSFLTWMQYSEILKQDTPTPDHSKRSLNRRGLLLI